MNSPRYVRWQDQGMWPGYLEELPDYMTQGETLAELEANLRDLHRDITSAAIPEAPSVTSDRTRGQFGGDS